MPNISMKSLLESGVHFGHRTHRWHPQMKPYIFTERNGIHIIDLQQTVKAMDGVYKLVRDKVSEGGTVLFVGTKRQAVETIEEEAMRCGMPFVTVRWLGGMLTNWITMRQRINELERLERMREKGEFDRLTKKEGLMLNRKIDKLLARFGGIRKMHRLPDMVFIVDVRREETAVREANTLGIPIVALVDTNCDPRDIDFVIPSNDDAIRTIKLMVGFIADAVMEGKAMRKEDDMDELPSTPMPEGEEELSDDELLGASTLAKMEAAAESEVVEIVEETVTAEDAIEAEETDEEIVEDSETVAEAEAEEETEAVEEEKADESTEADKAAEVDEKAEDTEETEEE